MARVSYVDWITDEGLLQLEGWARDGLTDEQMAQNIGCRRETLYDWKKKHPNISNALKRGKEVVDRQVENALLKSALGFHYVEDSLANDGRIKQLKKFQQPSTTAQIFWLKNRKPNDWRDKHQVGMDVNVQVVFEGERDLED